MLEQQQQQQQRVGAGARMRLLCVAAAVAAAVAAVAAVAGAVQPVAATATGTEGDAADQAQAQEQQQQGSGGGGGGGLDDATRDAIIANVPEGDACRDEVVQFVNGHKAQRDMTQACQQVLMQAYQQTPTGALQMREQRSVYAAALTRLSPTCREQVSKATSDADVDKACGESLKRHMQNMQAWLFSSMVQKISAECKAEVDRIRKQESGTGRDLSRECVDEVLRVKPGALDVLEAQTQKRMEDPAAAEEEDRRAAQQQQQGQGQRRRAQQQGQGQQGQQRKSSSSGGDAKSGDAEGAVPQAARVKKAPAWKATLINLLVVATVVVPVVLAYLRYVRKHGSVARPPLSQKEREDIYKRDERNRERVVQKRKRLGLDKDS